MNPNHHYSTVSLLAICKDYNIEPCSNKENPINYYYEI